MAITNAQQYQQLVNKPADGKRPGYRGPGGYQGGPSRDVERPGRDKPGKDKPGNNREGPSKEQFQRQTSLPKKATPMDVREQARVGNTIKVGGVLDEPTRPGGGDRGGLEIFKAKRPTVSVPSFGPFSYLQKPIQTFSDYTAGKNRKFFEDVIRAGKIPGLSFTMTEDELEEKYQDYMADRLAGKIDAFGNPLGGRFRDSQGNIVGGREGPDNQPVPQADPTTTASTTTTSEEDEDDIKKALAIRFAGSEFKFADGGRIPAMGGGIMNTDIIGGFADGSMDQMGRQMYGLGKLVKSVTKGVKKIVKSPIGKAALIGAGFGLAGMGPFKGLAGSSFGKFLMGTKGIPGVPDAIGKGPTQGLLQKLFLKKGATDFALANLSPMKTLGIVSALPLLFGTGEEEEEQDPYRGPSIDIPRIRNNPYAFMAPRFEGSQFAADGGRIGYGEAGAVMSEKDMKKLAKSPLYKGFKKLYGADPSMAKDNPAYDEKFDIFEKLYKEGFQKGGNVEPVAKKTMPLIDMDGMEKDYRETGGFVEMGRMERADDVPARLSKNEFVFTADAVRNAGDGNIDKGAEVMYNMMKNLEAGGEVSEESQGLEGARKMFQTSQRLGEVI